MPTPSPFAGVSLTSSSSLNNFGFKTFLKVCLALRAIRSQTCWGTVPATKLLIDTETISPLSTMVIGWIDSTGFTVTRTSPPPLG